MASQRNDAAKNVTAKHKDRILGLPGVTGIFTGEKTTGGEKTGERSVVVSVERKKPLSAIPADERIPATLDGIPTDVIEEVFRPCSDESRYDPFVGGTSISVTPEIDSSFSSGTAGMIVADVATGDRMILSCWHVLYGAGVGTAGDIVTNPPYAGGDPTPDKVGTTTRFSLSSTVDGAVARAMGRATSPSIVDIGTPTGIAPASVDMVVRKRGKTSGLTVGVVTATDWSGLIDYGPPVGVVSFENMIRFEGEPGMVLGGDSGSVLVAGGGGGIIGIIVGDWEEDEPSFIWHVDSLEMDNLGGGHNTVVEVDPDVDWTLTATIETQDGCGFHLGISPNSAPLTGQWEVLVEGTSFFIQSPDDGDVTSITPFDDDVPIDVVLTRDAGTGLFTATLTQGAQVESLGVTDPAAPGGTGPYRVFVLASGSGTGLLVTAIDLVVG